MSLAERPVPNRQVVLEHTEARMLNLSDAERVYGVSKSTLRKWNKESGFPFWRKGGVTLVCIADADAWFAEQEQP